MKWFKFYGQDYLSDPKMLSLNACERSCWITLLSYSSINDNGMITHLSEHNLMIQAGVNPMEDEWDTTKGIIEKLVKLEMITNDNGMITVKNWQKRQETNLTSYERVKRNREKKRNDNAMITLEENRIEENRIDKLNTPANAGTKKQKGDYARDALFPMFWEHYPNKTSKKKAEQIWERIFQGKTKEECDTLFPKIFDGLTRAVVSAQWQKDGGQFIPHPTTWLNQERWNDEATTLPTSKTIKI